MKILLIRNDKLGDFILSLPCFGLLKNSIMQSEVHALVPQYTSDIAGACQWIDHVVVDPGPEAGFSDQLKLWHTLRANKYDAIISLYSTTRLGIISLFSGSKFRLAPATKLAQLFYLHRLKQRRSQSRKPEYQYNLDLVEHFLAMKQVQPRPIEGPYLQFDQDDISTARNEFRHTHSIPDQSKIIFVHAGSGGSANNLTLQQYADLIMSINKDNAFFVLTAGPYEITFAQQLSQLVRDTPHCIFHSTAGLINFARHIAMADLFISGSTGPLHLAGALDTPTVAFYPRRQSATSLRWQTLNSPLKRLAFMPPEGVVEDMSQVDVKLASAIIVNEFF